MSSLPPLIFRLAAFYISALCCAHAFSLVNTSSKQGYRTTNQCALSQPFDRRVVLKAAESNEDDDDGWGDAVITTTTAESSDRISKSRELASLQNDMAMKQQKQRSSSTERNGEERDLFIPIVTLVSSVFPVYTDMKCSDFMLEESCSCLGTKAKQTAKHYLFIAMIL